MEENIAHNVTSSIMDTCCIIARKIKGKESLFLDKVSLKSKTDENFGDKKEGEEYN